MILNRLAELQSNTEKETDDVDGKFHNSTVFVLDNPELFSGTKKCPDILCTYTIEFSFAYVHNVVVYKVLSYARIC